MKYTITFELDDIPVNVVSGCKSLDIPDSDIVKWYGNAVELAINEERPTVFDDKDMIEHIHEMYKEWSSDS